MRITVALCISTALLGFWLGKTINQGEIADLKLEHANGQISQYNEAISRNSRHARNVSVARDKASVRNSATNSDLLGNRLELERLRDDAAASAHAASDNLNACTAYAATVTELFGACASEIVDLAAEADRWVTQVILIQDVLESAEIIWSGDGASEAGASINLSAPSATPTAESLTHPATASNF